MLDGLQAAIAELESGDLEHVDPAALSALGDRLQAILCCVLHRATQRGDNLRAGQTPCGWVATVCRLTPNSAGDRLCVGAQLEHLPRLGQALSSGEIGYQATSLICHLSDQLGEKRDQIEEETWIDYSKRFSLKELRYLTYHAHREWDPEGFDKNSEEDYEKRYLHLSPLGRMFKLDAVLDHQAGLALRIAIDALSKPLGSADDRSPKQRRADALTDLVHHALDQGTLPRRNGVRPHVTVHTTVEALQDKPGAGSATLEDGMPISTRTLQRLACDSTLSRVVKADSVVVDVGRATRSVSPAQWRALKARHRTCAFPCCDRPINWTSPHHVEFWSRGGSSNLPNLLPLCHYHHRLVHEGGWQVIRAGEGYRFLGPVPAGFMKRRWGESAAA
jgi:Domain of unknown function (DUF222)